MELVDFPKPSSQKYNNSKMINIESELIEVKSVADPGQVKYFIFFANFFFQEI